MGRNPTEMASCSYSLIVQSRVVAEWMMSFGCADWWPVRAMNENCKLIQRFSWRAFDLLNVQKKQKRTQECRSSTLAVLDVESLQSYSGHTNRGIKKAPSL